MKMFKKTAEQGEDIPQEMTETIKRMGRTNTKRDNGWDSAELMKDTSA